MITCLITGKPFPREFRTFAISKIFINDVRIVSLGWDNIARVRIQFDRNRGFGVGDPCTSVYLPVKTVTICVPVHAPGRKNSSSSPPFWPTAPRGGRASPPATATATAWTELPAGNMRATSVRSCRGIAAMVPCSGFRSSFSFRLTWKQTPGTRMAER